MIFVWYFWPFCSIVYGTALHLCVSTESSSRVWTLHAASLVWSYIYYSHRVIYCTRINKMWSLIYTSAITVYSAISIYENPKPNSPLTLTGGNCFRAGPGSLKAASPFLKQLPASRRKSGSDIPVSIGKREPEPQSKAWHCDTASGLVHRINLWYFWSNICPVMRCTLVRQRLSAEGWKRAYVLRFKAGCQAASLLSPWGCSRTVAQENVFS